MNDIDMKARHRELHRSLDELIACFLATVRPLKFLDMTIGDFMKWSFTQTIAPACEHHNREAQEEPWMPTPANINALPDPIREYIADLRAEVARLREDKEHPR